MSSFEPYETESGLSRRAVECIVALLLCAVAIAVLWDSYGRGAGWDGGPQSGFFPARMAWLLLAASAVVFFQGLRAERGILVTWGQLRQVSMVLLPLTLYVLAIGYLGIYVASVFFLAGFMIAFGSFRWWTILAASVLIPVITFWVFEMQFEVPLPKGPLEAMLGF
ncbi:tripartite tricarboxylate transporter TctB family protein [Ancylobacter mangrovi]|uniref:Tripartite tricarboxylate transporter TctB family protein n=1 Tax=Ancylobacter mangrovi TaxID=2972472 RepID=A0A9X2PJI4_9HYPH|nr:tripartite tricarboxylate transporter TctB family protein [Ancylobacter mangrovi]MCS0497235.1 tripartite tricarboxylate transporter TctB family protein [Ancylobacter mangrovi]MCS0505060.1 tripartite tricarboxylate transporter TctB family protein [Ancylobacter mangrovi]